MTNPGRPQHTWASPEWRGQVQTWIGQVLGAFNIVQTGPLDQPRTRFWSAQFTVPTDHGRMWFKENNPGQFQEAAIVACLAELAPAQVVEPLAIDPTRGWMISPDHGATLATLKSTDYQLWSRVLTDFAGLQRKLVPHGKRLMDAGLASMDPAIAGNFVSNQLLLHTGLPPEHPLHLDASAADHIHASVPRIEEAATALKALGIPLSLQHNDLHANNAFIPGTSTDPLRFFDFADAYWAHPFSSLYVPLGIMMEQWQAGPDDARIRRVITTYLECWTDYAPLPELRAGLEPALQLGRLQRYGSWLRLLIHADDESMTEYGPPALAYLMKITKPVLE
ncbi:phosphotransferase [Arthrobacter sp. H5]|uniref:phosphotransferase n=1 Tax=Arthrobacter sp. H5 TaxID=1267973 RepID=UPI00048376DE|nr:phosphotransferase [Arthrobacter sp. H5]